MKKYQSIITNITDEMKKGQLKKGDKLDSIKNLAKKYDCNKDTVLKALFELSKEQLVYSVPRSGYYVMSDISKDLSHTDFKTFLPDILQVPFGDFSLCLNKVLNTRDNYLFSSKTEPRGLSDLIDSVYNLLPTYSVYTKKNQVFVATGAQQALYILSEMEFKSKKTIILLEQPTYNRMNNLLKILNLPYKTIERNLQGIDLNELENIFQGGDVKFFYTISRLHYPLGIGYREEEKIKIVELAKKYSVYIVEDDYMADFDNGTSLPLHYYDISERVIYIKSFSSVVFSSLRLALVILPKELTNEFLKHKSLMDIDTNLLLQKALSMYIDNGMFIKHRDKLVALYSEKNAKLKQSLAKTKALEYSVYGTKTIFKIKDKKNVGSLKLALANKYKIDFLEDCYIDFCPYKYIKIDVRNMSLLDIDKNVSNLLKIILNYN